ncbi:hypothetical protein GALMADRAFT_1249324 [Galerina marginata CBS 339.88]|uniref:Uncharacterized protein n=1 Tax=Galerina marginata (strain CBS 339.88) TaxID=685588 RepID=A0A067T7T6_GALM3|nr:hypothetical protein GALMADRAFT_1249324 [Galerina marginata CBS 339.88]
MGHALPHANDHGVESFTQVEQQEQDSGGRPRAAHRVGRAPGRGRSRAAVYNRRRGAAPVSAGVCEGGITTDDNHWHNCTLKLYIISHATFLILYVQIHWHKHPPIQRPSSV